MRCPNCGTTNPDDARFCHRCGNELDPACARCGGTLPDEAVFCPHCGHEVGAPVDEVAAGRSPSTPDPPTWSGSVAGPATVDDRLRRFVPEELLAKLERAAERGLAGERRRVTMLFCDVQGSTAAAEHLDPEEWADIMNGAFERLIAPIYHYEGTLARLMGDAVLAFFGAPISHEDDPERAVRAGLEILSDIEPYRREVRSEWGIDLNVRIGINSGLVVVGAVGSDLRVEYTAMGDAVNVAARMEQSARPGTVQVSSATRQLVEGRFDFEELGEVEVRGRDEPVGAHRVLRPLGRHGARRGIEGVRAPLIGREAEMDLLRSVVSDLSVTGAGGVVSIVGDAGLGKSRLVAELRDAVEASGELSRIEWIEGRSLSYETGRPLAPVEELVRGLVGLDETATDDASYARLVAYVHRVAPGRAAELAPFVGAMLGLQLPEQETRRLGYFEADRLRAETFRALVDLLEAIAARRPTVLVLEDLHWADSASVDLVEQLLDLADRAALLLVLVFRPRREDRSWGVHELAVRDHPHLHTTVALQPLSEESSRTLVGSLLEVDGLPEALRRTILAKAEGNPFFVEEVVRSMIDRGDVRREGERWTATSDVHELTVPDALSALITSRLDRLPDAAKDVAQAASVLGREFRYDELVAVFGEVEHLDDALVDLQRREFLREVARLPRRRFRFKHALVQETVYETVLLKTRTRLHAAAADFLERFGPERVEDIAEHLLRARQVARAVPYLLEAGQRALRAHALPEALRRMQRAVELLGDTSETALLRRALEGLGRARELALDFEGATTVYTRLRDEGERRGDVPMRISGQNKLALLTGSVFARRDEALNDLAEAETLARSTPDEGGLLEACINQCFLRTAYAEFDEVEHYMREVSRLGTELDDEDSYLFGLTHLANTLVMLTRFDEGLPQAQEALAEAERLGHLRFQSELLVFPIPICHLRNGEAAEAMAAIERGLELALRIGDRAAESLACSMQGRVAMLRGEFEAAFASFRRAVAAADATGIPHVRAAGRCLLGTCYQQVGGPMLDRALQLHDETLELMRMPRGTPLGTWMWSEMAACALEAGDLQMAADLVRDALHERNMMMFLMRPQALLVACRLALARGRLDEARAHARELADYVAERQMQDQQMTASLARAQVAAASGEHVQALELLERCDAMAASMDLRRVLLDIRAMRARSLEALNRREEAAGVRSAATEVVTAIAATVHDPELRTAFLTGSSELLSPAG